MKRRDGLYSKVFSTLKDARSYVLAAFVIFLVSSFVGFHNAQEFTFFDSFLRELALRIEGLSTGGLIFFILQNNALAAFMGILAGIFFGILPGLGAAMNGIIVGYVVRRSMDIGSTFADVLLRLLPHGIFELPAAFMALGLGMWLGFGFVSTFLAHAQKQSKRIVGIASLLFAFIGQFIISAYQLIALGPGVVSGEAAVLAQLAFLAMRLLLFLPLCYLLFVQNAQLRKKQWVVFKQRLYGALRVFFALILPLLIIAAIIEGFLIGFVA